MNPLTSISNPEMFADAPPLPAGFHYLLQRIGVYTYSPDINNLYTIGVVREAGGVVIGGIDFYPDPSYATPQDMLTDQATNAFSVWNERYLIDLAVQAAQEFIGF